MNGDLVCVCPFKYFFYWDKCKVINNLIAFLFFFKKGKEKQKRVWYNGMAVCENNGKHIFKNGQHNRNRKTACNCVLLSCTQSTCSEEKNPFFITPCYH